MNDSLNEEQLSKAAAIPEIVDLKGVVQRHHVLDQNMFDRLLIRKKISIAQHSAACEFIHLLEIAGAFLKSHNLEPGRTRRPGHKVGDDIGSRIMSMSACLRRVKKEASDEAADALIRCCYGLVTDLEQVRAGLDVLTLQFDTGCLRDPRDLFTV